MATLARDRFSDLLGAHRGHADAQAERERREAERERRGLQALSPGARALLETMTSEYVACGYMYSGSLGPEHMGLRAQLRSDEQSLRRAFHELCDAGFMEPSGSAAENYLLTAQRRVTLIDRHDLATAWELKGAAFYPSDPEHGELARARAQAARAPATSTE